LLFLSLYIVKLVISDLLDQDERYNEKDERYCGWVVERAECADSGLCFIQDMEWGLSAIVLSLQTSQGRDK